MCRRRAAARRPRGRRNGQRSRLPRQGDITGATRPVLTSLTAWIVHGVAYVARQVMVALGLYFAQEHNVDRAGGEILQPRLFRIIARFLALPRRFGETPEIDRAAAVILAIEGHEVEGGGPNHAARSIERPVGRDRPTGGEQVGADELRGAALPLPSVGREIAVEGKTG